MSAIVNSPMSPLRAPIRDAEVRHDLARQDLRQCLYGREPDTSQKLNDIPMIAGSADHERYASARTRLRRFRRNPALASSTGSRGNRSNHSAWSLDWIGGGQAVLLGRRVEPRVQGFRRLRRAIALRGSAGCVLRAAASIRPACIPTPALRSRRRDRASRRGSRGISTCRAHRAAGERRDAGA